MREPEAYRKNGMKNVEIPHWLIFKKYWPRVSYFFTLDQEARLTSYVFCFQLVAISICWFSEF